MNTKLKLFTRKKNYLKFEEFFPSNYEFDLTMNWINLNVQYLFNVQLKFKKRFLSFLGQDIYTFQTSLHFLYNNENDISIEVLSFLFSFLLLLLRIVIIFYSYHKIYYCY